MRLQLCLAVSLAIAALSWAGAAAPVPAPSQDAAAKVEAALKRAEELFKLNKHKEVKALLEEHLALARSLGKDVRLAHVLNDLGWACVGIDNPLAVRYSEEAVELYRQLGRRYEEGRAARNLGWALGLQQEHRQAHEWYTRALPLLRGGPKPTLELWALIEASDLSRLIGDYQGYDRYTEEAVALGLKLGASYHAEALLRRGWFFEDSGEFDKAIETLTLALSQGPALAAEVQYALGVVYNSLGQWEKSQYYYELARNHYLKSFHASGISNTTDALGWLYVNTKQYEKARDLLTGASKLALMLGRHGSAALCELGIGYSYWRQARYEEALRHFERCRDFAEKSKSEAEKAFASGGMAFGLAGVGRPREALPFAEHAVAFYKKKRNAREQFISLGALAYVHKKDGQFERASEIFHEMAQLLNLVRKRVRDPGELGSLQTIAPNFYGHHAQTLHWNKQDMEALCVMEAGRAWGIAAQVEFNALGHARPYFKDDRFAKAQQELRGANQGVRQAEMALDAASGADRAQRERELERAKKRQTEAEAALARAGDVLYAKLPTLKLIHENAKKPPNPLELAKLARDNPDTLFLQWAMVDEHTTLLFALGKSVAPKLPEDEVGLAVHELKIGESEVERQVGLWRASLDKARWEALETGAEAASRESDEERRIARHLYDQLLGPLESSGLLRQSAVRRIVVVPDGPLLHMPVAALLTPSGQRMIERWPLSTSVSFGTLAWPKNPRRPKRTLLCVADPSADADVVAAKLDVTPEKQSTARGRFGALKHAREEGRLIASLFKGAKPLIGAAATETTVRAQMPDHAILHFACHGLLDASNGLRTSLVLAPDPSGEDGLLQGREIVMLPLSARLVVLSACDTGRGRHLGGDGVQSLAWAFQAAGCDSVVASQWQVDDQATGELMKAFYEELSEGHPKDAALRNAVLRAIDSGRRHPYWWGAFQISGDCSPLPKGLKF